MAAPTRSNVKKRCLPIYRGLKLLSPLENNGSRLDPDSYRGITL